jgi:hypothetical protein
MGSVTLTCLRIEGAGADAGLDRRVLNAFEGTDRLRAAELLAELQRRPGGGGQGRLPSIRCDASTGDIEQSHLGLRRASIRQTAQGHLQQISLNRVGLVSTRCSAAKNSTPPSIGGHVQQRLECRRLTTGSDLPKSLWREQQRAFLLA